MAVLLVRLHRQQLLATPSARRHLLLLHQRLHAQVLTTRVLPVMLQLPSR